MRLTRMNRESYEIIDYNSDNGYNGYESKEEAERKIDECYNEMPCVTTYEEDGRWYIVQSKALLKLHRMAAEEAEMHCC